MESVYIDTFLKLESLFIATGSWIGILFKSRQSIVYNPTGLCRQLINRIHRLLPDDDPEIHIFISDS